MPSSKKTYEERLDRIRRGLAEDNADRLPVTVRRADGSTNFSETGRLRSNNAGTDIRRRVDLEYGNPQSPQDYDSPDRRAEINAANAMREAGMKKGGKVKKMAGGGCARGDGVAQRGKTKGRMI
jgi:hypothetical protein